MEILLKVYAELPNCRVKILVLAYEIIEILAFVTMIKQSCNTL